MATKTRSSARVPRPLEPHVGIFWAYRTSVIAFVEPATTVEPVGGVRDSSFAHDALWSRVQHRYPELFGREYFDVPRGRVVHRVADGLFDVFLPTKLQANPRWIDRIKATFALPETGTRFRTDPHYEPVSRKHFND